MTQSPCLPEMPKPGSLTCTECGMLCEWKEFHPFAACLMFKGCHDSDKVRANLNAVREAGSTAAAQAVPEGYKLISGHAYGQNCVSLVEQSGKTVVIAYEQGSPQMFAFLTALAAPTQGAEGAAPQTVVGEASELTDQQCAAQLAVMKSPPMKDGGALHDWACSVLRAGYRLATPTAPQEADALREALKACLDSLEYIDRSHPEVTGSLARFKSIKAARAALAQHQPQQGEQHE